MTSPGRAPWRTAFDQTYAEHKDRLLTLAMAFMGNRHAAEDVVHDVFSSLLTQTSRLNNGSNLRAYLSVCVRNSARLPVMPHPYHTPTSHTKLQRHNSRHTSKYRIVHKSLSRKWGI